MPLRRPARLSPLLSSLLLTAGIAGAAVPQLTEAASAQTTALTNGPSRHYAVLAFHKNYTNTFRSELTWRVYRLRDGQRTVVAAQSWRAGSGSNRHATNSCRRNVGWLPNGWYRPTLYADYPGNLIKGRAISLGAKACSDGTVRTALFIHTEQGAHSIQCADTAGDQPCRWEYPEINDYRSLGCVKLAPGDMAQLYAAWTRFFHPGSDARVRVWVG